MPRRNKIRRDDEPRPLGGGLGSQRVESGSDGDWQVRHIPGAQATKTYRCPGCDHEIQPGTPHLVAWPAQEYGTVEDRRHWHPHCWNSRKRRPRRF
ncbi:hypothetical protein [Actinokineospora diospyrosa]|uniref:ATP/GTP-binding protein n=1 Tax=Actinokineospora diospyrosa TaxID=103728 RepID=A0ABT1IBG1_9PSEU|nr:hypothetical protein [Actinokineospora diospyrosa]